MRARQTNMSDPDLARTAIAPEQFRRIRDALASYSGVYIDDGRQRLLEQCIVQRLAVTNTNVANYARLVCSPDGRRELQLLAELVLNHETMFFRNVPHIRALQSDILPELHRRKQPGAPLRLWSAGCATGEEAYSLAIAATETLGRTSSRSIEVIGTDLSETALAKARAGVYRGRSLGNLSPTLRQRYFVQQGDALSLNEDIRSMVRFERLNLLEPFPIWSRGVDLIFCQNVTIYFQIATCRALMERFYQLLPEGGFLFLGFSETLWHIFNRFLTRESAGSFVYYKESSYSKVSRTKEIDQRSGTRPLREAQPLVGVPPQRQNPVQQTTSSQEAKPARNDQLILRRSRALLEGGDAERALEVLRGIPPDSDSTPEALVLIARAHAGRDDLDLALAEVLRACELNPLNVDAHILLGLIYGRQMQWTAAVTQFERARYLDGTAPLPSFHLAEAYRALERYEAAIREYRNTLQKLLPYPPDTLLDGVAVGWIRETCQRYLQHAAGMRRQGV